MRLFGRQIGNAEPKGSSTVWARERRVLEALKKVLPGQPYTLAGRYSWLQVPDTKNELQLDIFFHKVTEVAGVELAEPTCLAVEVQSVLHEGKWNRSTKYFFRSKEAFERYTKHQEWKRNKLQLLKIPFLEIDPDKDSLTPTALRRQLGKLLGLIV